VLGQAGMLGEALRPRPGHGQQPDSQARQAASDEAERAGARPVEPLQVIDDHQQRTPPARLAEQRQRGLEDDQPVLCRLGVAIDGQQGAAVQRAQRRQAAGQRTQELSETGEAHPGPEFTARRTQDLDACGRRGILRRIEERGFADAWLPGEQKRPGIGDLVEECGDEP
jgi:hypothetical protein